MSGPTDFAYVSPEKAKELNLIEGYSLQEYEKLAGDKSTCQCGQQVWRYGRTDMCFPCTTGESDASDDYEIGDPYKLPPVIGEGKMDTGNLMSSLREMIQAEVLAVTASSHEEAEERRLYYSRHETVVREELQKIGNEIAILKSRTVRQQRLGGNS